MAVTSTTRFAKSALNKQKNNQVYNVLLIGETGSGKSTLINYITNFFNGADLDNLKIIIPNRFYTATEVFKFRENQIEDATSSKTSEW